MRPPPTAHALLESTWADKPTVPSFLTRVACGRLTFPNTEERGLFQEKLIALCAETKKMNMPQEEEVRQPEN